MSCVDELRGLGGVQRALAAKGGRVLALSVDPPALLAGLARRERFEFPLLSDERRAAIRAYGLVHRDGAGAGRDLALPAQLLVRRDGTLAWSHLAQSIDDRAEPSATLRAVEELA